MNDIAAMGGRARALVDLLFAGEDRAHTQEVYAGSKAGSELFGVPIVGGHTGASASAPCLSAAVLGKAERLITSFAARPGQTLLACVDLGGQFRGDQAHVDALTGLAGASRVSRAPGSSSSAAGRGGARARGQRHQRGGAFGNSVETARNLGLRRAHRYRCRAGARMRTHAATALAFQSFGFLLAVEARDVTEIQARFADVGVTAAAIGTLQADRL